MNRLAVMLLLALGLTVTTVLIFIGISYQTNLHRAARDQQFCDTRLAQLQHDLPLGASREEVLSYLHTHGDNVVRFGGAAADNLSVDLGRVQSTVWFCNFFEEYADLTFHAPIYQGPEYLIHITTESVGQCL